MERQRSKLTEPAAGGAPSAGRLHLSPHRAVKDYLYHMLSSVEGLKALILDGDNAGVPVQGTIQRISAVESTQSLAKQGVFFTEKLQDPRSERVGHLKAVVWVRPIEENIELLCKELRDPKYGEYHLFFTNHSPYMKEYVKRLALADEFELLRNIGEYYSDFVAVSPELFSLNMHHHSGRQGWLEPEWRAAIVSGLLSVLLSLRAKPVVRYSARSKTAGKLAAEIERLVGARDPDTAWVRAHWDGFQDQALEAQMALGRAGGTMPLVSGGGGAAAYESHRRGFGDDTVLLIVDRADDPVTPLVHQWHYQAMIYDMITQSSEKMLGNNLVQFRPTAARLQDEGEQMINLSCEQDRFYRENRYEFWPTVTEKIGVFQSQYVARFPPPLSRARLWCLSLPPEVFKCRCRAGAQIQKNARATPRCARIGPSHTRAHAFTSRGSQGPREGGGCAAVHNAGGDCKHAEAYSARGGARPLSAPPARKRARLAGATLALL